MSIEEKQKQIRALGTGKGDFLVPDDFDDVLGDDILSEFEKDTLSLDPMPDSRD